MRPPVLLLLFALIAGATAGALAARWYDARDASTPAVVHDLVASPSMPDVVAEKHRKDNFRTLNSVAEIFGLPTAFARREALYVLAGRSDAAAVHGHIFAAVRIADEVEREQALNVLFFRLAELDPPSALALVRTESFRPMRGIENRVWSAWARKDFEGALFAAKTETTSAAQNSAAQALYAAFGSMGNETTDRIGAELGIGPDRAQRASYLYRLADRSPKSAIDYINAMPVGTEKTWNVNWLANYLALDEAEAALAHARHFDQNVAREQYETIIRSEAARANPAGVIERYLTASGKDLYNGELQSAISAMADEDTDVLESYIERAVSPDARQHFAYMYLTSLVSRDPQQAIDWARDNESFNTHPQGLLTSALQQIARTDPELAMAEALKTTRTEQQRGLLGNVFGQAAEDDPHLAMSLTDGIANARDREDTQRRIVTRWLQAEPEGAIAWLDSLDETRATALLNEVGPMLARYNPGIAIELLPRVDEEYQNMWRAMIIERLASTGSDAEAMNFIRQFEGEAAYAGLQAQVIGGIAQRDFGRARQLAEQLPDAAARDAAYLQLTQHPSQAEPESGLTLLPSISDPVVRAQAAANVVGQWYEADPDAATRWVVAQPAGAVRDQAVRYAVNVMRDAPPEILRLVDEIGDPTLRVEAKIGRAYSLMSTDREQAQKALEDPEIPDYMRQRMQEALDSR